MKRLIALLLSCCIFLTGCSFKDVPLQNSSTNETISEPVLIDEDSDNSTEESVENFNTAPSAPPVFNDLSDTELHRYLEDDVYAQLVNQLDSDDYFVEDVQVQYLSKEYLEELEYNSKENVFFGYALSDLVDALGDTKYVFTLGDDGQTTIKPFEAYDDTFDKVIKNVAIGTGVILVCVTVSIVTAGVGAPAAVTAIFAASAKDAAISALSGGLFDGVMSGIITGVQTGDFESAKKAALLGASNGFKWGAISGAVVGGASEAILLRRTTLNGLTMSEAAAIQKETKFSADIIKNLHSMEEYNIYKEAGLLSQKINGRSALVRNIDLNYVGSDGLTNLQRIQKGLSPLDKTGGAYELHHIGQSADAPLAILTKSEHMQGGNNTILHFKEGASEVSHGADWQRQVKEFWKAYAEIFS